MVSHPNLAAAFFASVADDGGADFLAEKTGGAWQSMTRQEVADKVRRLASFLKSHGIKKGDRVIIASANSPRWVIADLAIMSLGAIVTPAYTTNTAADHFHIMRDSGAVLAIVSAGVVAQRVMEAVSRDSKNTPRKILFMDDAAGNHDNDKIELLHWHDAMAMQPGNISAEIKPDDIAALIYTSGTGGAPKGVMLTHRSIQANIDAARDLLADAGIAACQRFLSLLPLSHAYEHTAGLHLPVQIGAEIWYCEGAEHLARNLAETAPTLMTAVPRLYEVLYDRITKGVAQKGGITAWLFRLALAAGLRRIDNKRRVSDFIFDPVFDLLVRRKVRARFGGRLKFFISGGSALNPDIGRFFLAIGVELLQGYGLTEASPLIAVNRPGRIRIETVGPPVRGVEARIGEGGEILVRGDMVMRGYWRDAAASRAVLRDGWLHTGDCGSIDADGSIRITGRLKEIIVTSGGENIAPTRLEGIFALEPEIEQIMVEGSERPYPVAVVVPATMADGTLATESEIAAAIARVNAGLASHEKIRRFILADESFSVENEQLTPTLKVRRHVVRRIYGARLNALYGNKAR